MSMHGHDTCMTREYAMEWGMHGHDMVPATASGQDTRRISLNRVSELSQLPSTAWQEKVEELSQRGIAIGDMLIFALRLLDEMPSFEPRRSSTRDVVRGAVIPWTSQERCSYGGVHFVRETEQ